MNPVLLSIVIPSLNGAIRVTDLLKTLDEIIPESAKANLEIVVSDNHSNPKINLSPEIGLGNRAKIVSPAHHLLTAEENLLFALHNSIGTYCWILGDNDVPLENGVKFLLKLLEKPEFDLLVFNSLALDMKSNAWDIHRLDLDKLINKMSFVDFVKRAGFWSITAGFSTLVFRRDAFNLNFMQDLHSDHLKIYSHVTTLLESYHDKSFAAIALPLVKYSSNSFDDEPVNTLQRDNHWVDYSHKQNEAYRMPWTLNFLKQIDELESRGIFSKSDLLDVLDQGHTGQRFFLYDNILAFLIDQVLYQTENEKSVQMTDDEIHFVLTSMSGNDIEFDRIIAQIELLLHSKSEKSKLKAIIDELTNTDLQMQRRFVMKLAGGKIYRSPYGQFWSPFQLSINQLFLSLSNPRNGLCANDFDELENKIHEFKGKNPFYEMGDFSSQINVAGLNSSITKLHRLFQLIPSALRRKLK